MCCIKSTLLYANTHTYKHTCIHIIYIHLQRLSTSKPILFMQQITYIHEYNLSGWLYNFNRLKTAFPFSVAATAIHIDLTALGAFVTRLGDLSMSVSVYDSVSFRFACCKQSPKMFATLLSATAAAFSLNHSSLTMLCFSFTHTYKCITCYIHAYILNKLSEVKLNVSTYIPFLRLIVSSLLLIVSCTD